MIVFFLVVMMSTVVGEMNTPHQDKTESTNLTNLNDGGLMDSAWPIFKHDIRHTGRSPYGPTGNWPIMKWKFKLEGMTISSPSLDENGSIYIGATDFKNSFFSINKYGIENWKCEIGEFVLSSPCIGINGIIYFGANDGGLYAFYPNGTKKWRTTIGNGWVTSSPVIDSVGIIYAASVNSNRLCAIYPNGTIAWSFYAEDCIYCSPAIDENGIIYVGSNDGYLYSIYPNGTLNWKYYAGGEKGIGAAPAIADDGTIYFGGTSGYLYALNPNGTLRWKVHTGWIGGSSPALDENGMIYVGDQTNNNIYCIDQYGNITWSYKTGDEIISSPAIDKNGIIYCGSLDGNLYALTSDGTLKWKFNAGNGIESSTAINEEGIIYITNFAYLYALKIIENQPPTTPNQPAGPTLGDINITYTYSTNPVNDPDENPVQYQFNWDDGTTSDWTDTPQASHLWTRRGDYNITVIARDNYSMESTSSEPLRVHIRGSELSIDTISGGFCVTAVIKNIGEMDVENVNWSMVFDGGIIILPENRMATGVLSLNSGEQKTIRSGLVLGFGGIILPTVQLIVTVGDTEATVYPRILFFIVSLRN
jgi:outer membrane protein assembly factor BamB